MKTVKQISLKQIFEKLNDGTPWYTSEANGDESVQSFYSMSTEEVDGLRKHPKLIGVEPADFVVFQIIDDLDEETPNSNVVVVDDTVNSIPVSQVATDPAPAKAPFDDMALPESPNAAKREAEIGSFDALLG
jgi:hypothetical protein